MSLTMQQAAQSARASRSIVVHFACNDGRNGLFAGEVENIAVDIKGGHQLELYGWARRFTVDDKGLRLCIHGIWFPFMSSREWVGNWCWNAYRLKRPQAIRLLAHLRWHGWQCEAGRVHAIRWFERMAVQPAKVPAGVMASQAPSRIDQRISDVIRKVTGCRDVKNGELSLLAEVLAVVGEYLMEQKVASGVAASGQPSKEKSQP